MAAPCWMLADSLLVFDQVRRQITALAYADLSGADGRPVDAEHAWNHAAGRIAALEARMHDPLPASVSPLDWHDAPTDAVIESLTIRSNVERDRFEQAVEDAREHIRAGDVFQLVLSQRLETRVQRDPFDLYRSLRMVNPSPYMAFFDFGDWHLIGSSPEVMVKAEPAADGTGAVKASLRPIAGTRPGATTKPKTKPSRPICWPSTPNGCCGSPAPLALKRRRPSRPPGWRSTADPWPQAPGRPSSSSAIWTCCSSRPPPGSPPRTSIW